MRLVETLVHKEKQGCKKIKWKEVYCDVVKYFEYFSLFNLGKMFDIN